MSTEELDDIDFEDMEMDDNDTELDNKNNDDLPDAAVAWKLVWKNSGSNAS